MISWSTQKVLGLSDEETRQVEVRAARIEEADRPDGQAIYVPENAEYAARNFRSKTLRGLVNGDYAE